MYWNFGAAECKEIVQKSWIVTLDVLKWSCKGKKQGKPVRWIVTLDVLKWYMACDRQLHTPVE